MLSTKNNDEELHVDVNSSEQAVDEARGHEQWHRGQGDVQCGDTTSRPRNATTLGSWTATSLSTRPATTLGTRSATINGIAAQLGACVIITRRLR